MLSIFTGLISQHKEIHICEFTLKFFMRELSPVNYGKKSVVDNIGPWRFEVCGPYSNVDK
jgi:hypothetical protein